MWRRAFISKNVVLPLLCVAAVLSGCQRDDFGAESMRQARVAMEQHNYLQAIEFADKAMSQGAMDVDLHLLRGHCYLQLQDTQQAITAFTDAVNYDPYAGEAMLYKAIAQQRLGEIEQAKQTLDQAYEVFGKIKKEPLLGAWPETEISASREQQIASDATVNQVFAKSLAGQHEEAVKQLLEVEDQYPGYPGLDRIRLAVQAGTVEQLMMGQ